MHEHIYSFFERNVNYYKERGIRNETVFTLFLKVEDERRFI
jgi:hypothetical protein